MFYVVCLIGVFNRESILPMVLCYPLSEQLLEQRQRWTTWLASAGVVGAWLVLRLLLPIPVNRYSLAAEFVPTIAQAKMIAVAVLITFSVLLLTAWRAAFSRVALSVTPLVVASIAAAWFVANTDRAVVQAIPFFLISLLGWWPVDRSEQFRVVAPALAFFVAVVVHSIGITYALLLPPLFAIVAVNEVLLARRWFVVGRADAPAARAPASASMSPSI